MKARPNEAVRPKNQFFLSSLTCSSSFLVSLFSPSFLLFSYSFIFIRRASVRHHHLSPSLKKKSTARLSVLCILFLFHLYERALVVVASSLLTFVCQYAICEYGECLSRLRTRSCKKARKKENIIYKSTQRRRDQLKMMIICITPSHSLTSRLTD